MAIQSSPLWTEGEVGILSNSKVLIAQLYSGKFNQYIHLVCILIAQY